MSKKSFKELMKQRKVVAIPINKGEKTVYKIMTVEQARKYLD